VTKPLIVTNVDSSNNSGERITHKVECNVYYRGHQERMKFDVYNLGRMEVILGMPWLAEHNPEIDWEKGEVKITRCPPWCGKNNRSKEARERQEKVMRRETRKVEEKKAISWVADKKEDWGREEEMQKFVDEHLKKGYIRPSKSQQTSPVFFVGKKDGGKCMVMDYCKLNRQTVKNNYLLPLITELVDNMGSKQVFTKMDLWWGYNNMRVKEGDKWKVAFTTHVGSFEHIVMFFGMTNLPATFQAMMNKILRDMINEGKVVAFVDDVLVVRLA